MFSRLFISDLFRVRCAEDDSRFQKFDDIVEQYILELKKKE